MTDNQNLVDAFAELRRTWDDLITLQPDNAVAAGPVTGVDLDELQRRTYAHESSLARFIETAQALRASAPTTRQTVRLGGSEMADTDLKKLLVRLSDAIRDLPPGPATDEVRDRVIDVIKYLERQHLIAQANWNLGPR